jgi:glutamate formiminotransferase
MLGSGRVQVSTNVVDTTKTDLHQVVGAIRTEARARGIEVAGGELVGLLPAGVVTAAAAGALALDRLAPDRVLELRLLDDQPA